MRSIRTVVIIPTFNNVSSIRSVIEDVARFHQHIIAINDGSTDGTAEILRSISNIMLFELYPNSGKGAALKRGFDEALKRGFTHAITFDGDGQHLARDIPGFEEQIRSEPDTLWIGNRIVPVDGGREQPFLSRFGRWFGAVWYRFYTGLTIRDTQCGFRAYPLSWVQKTACRSTGYEYEVEILIKAAWKGASVKSFPVHLLYFKDHRALSHFRPVRDFLRIGVVNSRAAITRIFLPRSFLALPGDGVFAKIGSLIMLEVKANASPVQASLSIALGVCMGIMPIHGFQVLALIGLTMLIPLNRPLAFLGVTVSSPPLVPFWIAAGLATGKAVLPESLIQTIIGVAKSALPSIVVSKLYALGVRNFAFGFVKFFVGSIILALSFGTLSFAIALPLFRFLEGRRKPLEK